MAKTTVRVGNLELTPTEYTDRDIKTFMDCLDQRHGRAKSEEDLIFLFQSIFPELPKTYYSADNKRLLLHMGEVADVMAQLGERMAKDSGIVSRMIAPLRAVNNAPAEVQEAIRALEVMSGDPEVAKVRALEAEIQRLREAAQAA
jgi:hypothetical protein